MNPASASDASMGLRPMSSDCGIKVALMPIAATATSMAIKDNRRI
jgi:hypothetical protein